MVELVAAAPVRVRNTLDHLPTRRALIVLCGPVAAGKTTLAMTRWPGAHIDSERIGWSASFRKARERLGRGALAVFDSTAVTEGVRSKCLASAREFHASAHIVLLNTSPGTCGVRNAERIDPTPVDVVEGIRVAYLETCSAILSELWDSITIL